jgi:hypothetical protein
MNLAVRKERARIDVASSSGNGLEHPVPVRREALVIGVGPRRLPGHDGLCVGSTPWMWQLAQCLQWLQSAFARVRCRSLVQVETSASSRFRRAQANGREPPPAVAMQKVVGSSPIIRSDESAGNPALSASPSGQVRGGSPTAPEAHPARTPAGREGAPVPLAHTGRRRRSWQPSPAPPPVRAHRRQRTRR